MTDDLGTEGQVGTRAALLRWVNGPEDDIFDWHQVDRERVEDQVLRLRQRTFTASKAGDLKRVRSLQKLMLRSRANALLSVRRVTEANAGRKTAGSDGKMVVTAPGKAALAERVHGTAFPEPPNPSDGDLQRGVRQAGNVPVEAHLQVGQGGSPE